MNVPHGFGGIVGNPVRKGRSLKIAELAEKDKESVVRSGLRSGLELRSEKFGKKQKNKSNQQGANLGSVHVWILWLSNLAGC